MGRERLPRQLSVRSREWRCRAVSYPRVVWILTLFALTAMLAMSGCSRRVQTAGPGSTTGGASRSTQAVDPMAERRAEAARLGELMKRRRETVKLIDSAKHVSLSLIMAAMKDQTFPTAEKWREISKKHSGRGYPNLTGGLEYNTALAGKKPSDIPHPDKTVMLYETGAAKPKSGGLPLVVAFVDGHVDAVDPGSITLEVK